MDLFILPGSKLRGLWPVLITGAEGRRPALAPLGKAGSAHRLFCLVFLEVLQDLKKEWDFSRQGNLSFWVTQKTEQIHRGDAF